jgi:hypothetical protein
MARLLALVAFALLGFSTARAQTPPLVCDDATVNSVMRNALAAYEARDWARAGQIADPLVSACGNEMIGARPRLFRAEMFVRQGDYQRALTVLRDAPQLNDRNFTLTAGWTTMRAALGAGDMATVNAARDRLLKAVEAALLADNARLRERVQVAGGELAIYETDFLQSSFRRRYVALYSRPDALPLSIMLTLNTLVALLDPGRADAYFVDGYMCTGHVTIDILEARRGRLPDYEEFRQRAIGFAETPLPDYSPDKECAFVQYLTPFPQPGDKDED